MMTFFLFLFLCSWAIYRVVPMLLEFLNMQASKKALPKTLRAYYDPTKYKGLQKSIQHEGSTKLVLLAIELFLGLAVIGFGLIEMMHDWVQTRFDNAYVVNFLFAVIVLFFWQSIHAYRHVASAKKGKVTAVLGKQLLHALIAGILIGTGICLMQFLQTLSATWFGLLTFFMFFLLRIIFNRLISLLLPNSDIASISQWHLIENGMLKTATPIWHNIPKEGTLAKSLETACKHAGLPLNQVLTFQTHAPKSAYSHAFVWKKRIFLSDHLLEEFSVEEVMAVIYHELWHIKYRSVRPYLKLICELVLCTAFGFFVGMPITQTFAPAPSLALAALSYWILISPLQLIYQLIANSLSRIQEWKADVYAYRKADRKILAKALGKLGALRMESATPHPLYVRFYYSHPPLVARIRTAKEAPKTDHFTKDVMADVDHQEQREDFLEQLDQIKAQLGPIKSEQEKKAERKAELEKRALAKSKKLKKLRNKKK